MTYVWLALAVAAFALGFLLTPVFARRSATRPVELELDAEKLVLAAVWARPSRLPYLLDLHESSFASRTYGCVWDAYLQAGALDAASCEEEAYAEAAGAALMAREQEWKADVLALLTGEKREFHALAVAGYEEYVTASLSPQEELEMDSSVVVPAAELVLGASEDRTTLNGRALILPSSDPYSTALDSPPMVRVVPQFGLFRKVALGLSFAAWVAALPFLLSLGSLSGAAAVFASASWLIMGFFMTGVAIIDQDTMYLDRPLWFIGTVLSWVAALGAAVFSSNLMWFFLGLGIVLLLVFFFEAINWVYTKVRKRVGMGFGDTLIIIATIGIPVALTGIASLAWYTLMASLLAAIAGRLVSTLIGKSGQGAAFAFAPWLAAGPIIGVIVLFLLRG